MHDLEGFGEVVVLESREDVDVFRGEHIGASAEDLAELGEGRSQVDQGVTERLGASGRQPFR